MAYEGLTKMPYENLDGGKILVVVLPRDGESPPRRLYYKIMTHNKSSSWLWPCDKNGNVPVSYDSEFGYIEPGKPEKWLRKDVPRWVLTESIM
jgi:hypothetical protein